MNISAIVVIGVSAGGMEPLFELVEGIPEDCQATFFVVQHIPAHAESNLHLILASHTLLTVSAADDQLPFQPGHIYTACSDRHLLVEEGRMAVAKGPRENHFRPSVDALFRSAAYAYRDRVIGVVMSGALNDGTSGMWAIKNFGGVSIIQSREEAVFDSMPKSVADYVELDYELPSREIGPMINRLTQQAIAVTSQKTDLVTNEKFTAFEINVAKGKNALERGVLEFGTFSPLACPECHGALTEYCAGGLKRRGDGTSGCQKYGQCSQSPLHRLAPEGHRWGNLLARRGFGPPPEAGQFRSNDTAYR